MKILINEIGHKLEKILDSNKTLSSTLPYPHDILMELTNFILLYKVPPIPGWVKVYEMTNLNTLLEEYSSESLYVTEYNDENFHDFVYGDMFNIIVDLIKIITINWPYGNECEADVYLKDGNYILDISIAETDKRNLYHLTEQAIILNKAEAKYNFKSEFLIFQEIIPDATPTCFKIFIEKLNILIDSNVRMENYLKKKLNLPSEEDLKKYKITEEDIKSRYAGYDSIYSSKSVELSIFANNLYRDPLIKFNGWLPGDDSFDCRFFREL